MKTLDAIAAELQGYDPQALPVSTVDAFIARMVAPLVVSEQETLPIFQALGRTLAVDVISPVNVPPHDNSAMDGYAFDGAALEDGATGSATLTLRCIGTALAGKAWLGVVEPGECVKIMTGAVMPLGLDTVVPQELTQTEAPKADITPAFAQSEHISFQAQRLKRGDNRRLCGEDLPHGMLALRAGDELNAAALGLVASLGLETVTVFRQLRVAYFSTGNEILSLGEPAREGAVYDSNRYTVFGLLTRLGCQMIDMGVVPDDPALLEAAFTQAAAQADAVITSGGVSVGEADYTKAMMKKLGDVAFWRIAMRPGRPMAVGRISRAKTTVGQPKSTTSSYQKNSSVLFGLPGNPVAVMVTFLAFVRPALLQMMGRIVRPTPLLKARSTHALRKKPGRTEYQRAVVSLAEAGGLQVSITGNQGSGVLSSMVQGNGLVVLHHGQGNVAAGDEVDVMMLDGLL